MSELVAVCMPVFNGGVDLWTSIERVLNQTHSNLQLIIVDDLSEDDTFQIVSELAARDSRIIRHRNQKRLGFAASFNQCLTLTEARFIKPLRQCDLLAHSALESGLSPFLAHSSIRMTAVPWRWRAASQQHANNDTENGAVIDLVNTDGLDANLKHALSQPLPIPGDAIVWGSLFPLRNIVGPLSTIFFQRISEFDRMDPLLIYFSLIDFYSQMLPDGRFCKVTNDAAQVEIGPPSQAEIGQSSQEETGPLWLGGVSHPGQVDADIDMAKRIASELIEFSCKNQWLIEGFSRNMGDFIVQSVDKFQTGKIRESLAEFLANSTQPVAAEIIACLEEMSGDSAAELRRAISRVQRFGPQSQVSKEMSSSSLTGLIASWAAKLRSRFRN